MKGLRWTFYWIVAGAAILALSVYACPRAEGSLSDCHDATCRISDGGKPLGTGCVFEVSQGRVYVLTAAHVVGTNDSVQCEFWHEGHRSQPLIGKVLSRIENDECDAAVISVPSSLFGGVLPKAIPVAPRDYKILPGATLMSVGCARGAWSTGWKGHFLGYKPVPSTQAIALFFTPTPAGGRSGSAIFNADGTCIVGVLRARTIDDSEGIASTVQSLYGTAKTAIHNAQCNDPNCESCDRGGSGPFQPYGGKLMPWRKQREDPAPAPMPTPYPTLPLPQQPAPAPQPSVDLTPLAEKLDTIAELLLEMQQGMAPPEVILEPQVLPPTVDTEALGLAKENQRSLLDLGESVQGTLEEVKTVKEEVGLATQIAGNAAEMSKVTAEGLVNAKKENGSVVERLQARIAQAKEDGAEGTKAVATKVVWDIIKSYGFGPVGVVGVLVFLVWRRIKTGESVVRRLRSHAKRGRLRISKLRRKLGEDTDEDDELDEEDEAAEEEAVAEA